MPRKNAFTLVELLVVVAIIALLLAILLPALNNARAVARSSVCMSHLRGINTAVSMYGSDNKDFAFVARIRRSIFNGNPGGPTPGHYPTSEFAEVYHEPLLGQYTHAFSGRVAWSNPLQRSVWRCPEDPFGLLANGLARPSYREVYRHVGSGAGQFFPYLTSPNDFNTRMNKLVNARQPSMIMTMLDRGSSTEVFAVRYWNDARSPMYANRKNQRGVNIGWAPDGVNNEQNHSMRHPPNELGTNMGFLDGSVRTIVNTPSDVDGEYWLWDQYRHEFVFRPADLR